MAWRSTETNSNATSSPLRPSSAHPNAPTSVEEDVGSFSLVDSNLERQEEELLCLQAVFDSDVDDLRGTNVWNTQRPNDVLLRLRPQASDINNGEVFAEIELRVKCSPSYPNDTPQIRLDKEKGLSKDQVKELSVQLTSLAAELVGEVMINDLALHVRNYLSTYNVPPAKSFHEQMLSNQKKREEQKIQDEMRKQEEERKKAERQARDVDHEIEKTQRALKEERRGKKTLTFNLDDDVIEFERMRYDSFSGSPAKEDVASTPPNVFGTPPTASTMQTLSRITTSPTRTQSVEVDALVTHRAAPLSGTVKKKKPLKDRMEDGRVFGKASSPIRIVTSECKPDFKTVDEDDASKKPTGRIHTASTSSWNSDNSEGVSEPPAINRHISVSDDCLKMQSPSPSTSPNIAANGPAPKETAFLTISMKHETRTVLRGRFIGQGQRGSTTYVGMDKSTGELVAIKEWRIPLLASTSGGKRKLSAILDEAVKSAHARHITAIRSAEEEFYSLSKLNNSNVIAYQGLMIFLDHSELVIHVLEDFVEGTNLSDLLTDSSRPVPIPKLKTITSGILTALDFLHEHFVCHKDLRPSSIFIDKDNRIRVGDFSLDWKLYDIACTILNKQHEKEEALPPPMGRSAKKQDVYRLGLLLLSLAQGSKVKEMIPDVSSAEFSRRFPLVFGDFLVHSLDQDERTRWSAKQLLSHNFLKEEDKEIQDDAKKTALIETLEKDEDEEADVDIPMVQSADASGQSRLTNEFEVLRWIGKGGFGDVIKVRNKLDAGLYAIKRIPLNPKSKKLTKNITREVKLLSRLNHDNVVRYFNSWIETCVDRFRPETTTDGDLSIATSDEDKRTSSGKDGRGGVANRLAILKKDAPKENSLGLVDDIEVDVPPPAETDSWKSDFDSWKSDFDDDGDDEDDDPDEDDEDMDVFGFSFGLSFDSDTEDNVDVVFDRSGGAASSAVSSNHDLELERTKSPEKGGPLRLQFLYIQMEYCEKSTLRNIIDSGELFTDQKRIWKLFREIVEGLAYIHDTGLIHRDLKPVNVFLSSDDHVKIGDFGLATKSMTRAIASSAPGASTSSNHNHLTPEALKERASLIFSNSGDVGGVTTGEESLTGKVGTALYVAPELMNSPSGTGSASPAASGGGRLFYTYKVDMYSLGICFFEMCYRPLNTGMERITMITNLRKNPIQFPLSTSDFDILVHQRQAKIIQCLLTHDVNARPSAAELLSSDLLPRPPLEEAQFVQSLKRALSQTGSANYHKLMGSLFERNMSVALDQCWDLENHQNKSAQARDTGNVSISARLEALVTSRLESIFSKHGALHVKTPLLLPKSLPIVDSRIMQFDQAVQILDGNGAILTLPYNLRVGFARYVARHGVTHLKRYAIDRVYHARRVSHVHPRELVECAFDVVTESPGNLIPDAEILLVAQEIIEAFPSLGIKNYQVKMNHPQLIKAILLHYGVPEEKFPPFIQVLNDTRAVPSSLAKEKLTVELEQLCIDNSIIDKLFQLLFENQGTFQEIAARLKFITKSKGLASSMARTGLHEIEMLVSNCEHLGIKLQLVVDLGLVNFIQHFSSVFFCVCSVLLNKPRKKSSAAARSVLAVGGRYDNLVSLFRRPFVAKTPAPTTISTTTDSATSTVVVSKFQCVAGISVAFAALVAAMKEEPDVAIPVTIDVLVASLGHRLNQKECLHLLRRLWNLHISADLAYDPVQSLEDLYNACRTEGVSCLVVFRDSDDGEDVTARLHVHSENAVSGGGGRWIEKRYPKSELPDVIHQHLKDIHSDEPGRSGGPGSSVENGSGDLVSGGGSTSITSSLSSNLSASHQSSSSTSKHIPLDIRFVFEDPKKDKLTQNDKRRQESKIQAKVNASVLSHQFRTTGSLVVVATDLPLFVVKTVAAQIDLSKTAGSEGCNKQKGAAIQAIIEKHQRFRKYVTEILDTIFDLSWTSIKGSSHKQVRPIILFSLKDEGFRILL